MRDGSGTAGKWIRARAAPERHRARGRGGPLALSVMLLCFFTGGCIVVPDEAPGHRTSGTARPGQASARLQPDAPMSEPVLQSEVLFFADRFLEGIAEATDEARARDPAAEVAPVYHQTKVIYSTSVISLATLADSVQAVRELLVFLTLAREVWSERAQGWADPAGAARVARALTRLDQDLEQLARRVLPEPAIDAVRELSRRWRQEHPDRSYVAFVRLSNLGDVDAGLFERATAKGLLAPVADVRDELRELRSIAERSLFIVNHFPLLAQWQAQSLGNALLATPDVSAALERWGRFTAAADEFGDDLAATVERLVEERDVTLRQAAQLLGSERKATLAQLATLVAGEREALFRKLEGSSENLLPLARSIERSSENFRGTLELLAGLPGDDAEGAPSAAELAALALELRLASQELNQLLTTANAMLVSEDAAAGLERLERSLRGFELRFFAYGIALVLVAALAAVAGALALRRLSASAP